MRKRIRARDSGSALFGATGWLIADLFIALTMAFLVANTVGQPPLPIVKHTPTPTPTVVPTPTALPALDLTPISITVQVNYQGILNGDPKAIASAEAQLRAAPQLQGKKAGLVLSFGGAAGVGTSVALQIAQQFDTRVLAALGAQCYVFKDTAYRSFFSLGGNPNQVEIDVYVFKQSFTSVCG